MLPGPTVWHICPRPAFLLRRRSFTSIKLSIRSLWRCSYVLHGHSRRNAMSNDIHIYILRPSLNPGLLHFYNVTFEISPSRVIF